VLSRDTTASQFGVPMTLSSLPQTPWRLVSAAATWHVTSQQRATRNALVASTALTDRRRELQEVERFLSELAANRRPVDRELSHPA
jgi:hypothetical protein